MKIALAITNQARTVRSVEQWIARVQRIALDCQDCDLLILPEYAAMSCLDYAPPDLKETEEVDWLADELWDAWKRTQGAAEELGMAILPGTWPSYEKPGLMQGSSIHNRAHLYGPYWDQQQDKLHLTKEERDRMGWYLRPGGQINTFMFQKLRTAIAICHDITSDSEFARLKEANTQLVLVPSMVEMLGNAYVEDSYEFIREHARKRSEELGCYVAWVSAAGTQMFPSRQGKRAPQSNVGGAALFKDGKALAAIGPFEELGGQAAIILKAEVG